MFWTGVNVTLTLFLGGSIIGCIWINPLWAAQTTASLVVVGAVAEVVVRLKR